MLARQNRRFTTRFARDAEYTENNICTQITLTVQVIACSYMETQMIKNKRARLNPPKVVRPTQTVAAPLQPARLRLAKLISTE